VESKTTVYEETSAMFEPTVRLTEEQIDRIAERVAERLREPTRSQLVDAATLAGQLGVSRDFVYAHARALGGKRLGRGPRERLRFDRERLGCVGQPRARR
jgi:hypothetical protein